MARLYEKLLDNENLYRKRRIQVFTPQFMMFYNGSEEQQSIIRSLCAVMSPELIAETLQLSLEYVQEVLNQPKAAV